jgi:hypothetical protein
VFAEKLGLMVADLTAKLLGDHLVEGINQQSVL